MPKLRVWHIPQIPMKAFHVHVSSPEEAIKILNTLADYDIFQFENHIKPDYSSAQGLEEFNEEDHEWEEWYNDDGLDIREYADEKEE